MTLSEVSNIDRLMRDPDRHDAEGVNNESSLLDDFLDSRLYSQPDSMMDIKEEPSPNDESLFPNHDFFDAFLSPSAFSAPASGVSSHTNLPQLAHQHLLTPPKDKNKCDDYNSPFGGTSSAGDTEDYTAHLKEFSSYEASRKELMKLKFGSGAHYTFEEQNPDLGSSTQSEYSIPGNYLEKLGDPSLPYELKISGLPSYSRVETQIKVTVSISPAPPQYLLHLPSDTISKTKLCVQGEIPESIKPHLLYLDTYVVATHNSSLRHCNICNKCVRRELKRASRRKNGTLEDGFNWNLLTPKRAIIFNCKEVISFPRPTGREESLEKSVDIMSRIICYCRHHQEPKGFKLLFALKNSSGEVLATTLSNPIMIMDRKKTTASGASEVSPPVIKGDLKPLSPTSIEDSSSEHQTDNQQVKRQKRHWSPGASAGSTYFDSVTRQRVSVPQLPRTESISSICVKKEPGSPPHNAPPFSRFDSVSSLNSVHSTANYLSSTSATSYSQHAHETSPEKKTKMVSPNSPAIQRIIPAQGPTRGGIEVTLLGTNFKPGLIVKFGANQALTTHCWSESTIVTYLPPASHASQVLVTFESAEDVNTPSQIFTYVDDTDRQLIELALQIVGLKMNGKLEEAKNIAKRIIGGNENSDLAEEQPASNNHGVDDVWLEKVTLAVEQLSQSCVEKESTLIQLLQLMDLPNCPVATPNWGVCTLQGQTLLHLAAGKGYFKLALFLINKGSKVDFKDFNELTPLHFAFIYGQREMIQLLIKCKASIAGKVNGVDIGELADSNVLDLVSHYIEDSNVSSSCESARRYSDESIGSALSSHDDCELRYRAFQSSENSDFSALAPHLSYENDADFADEEENAEDEEIAVSDCDVKPPVKREKRTLWRKMKKVFKKKHVTQPQPENLPSYDDLFPEGGSLKSLLKSYSSTEEVETSRDDLLFRSYNSFNRQSVSNDKMLLLFWIPMLMVILSILLLNRFGVDTLRDSSCVKLFDSSVESFREGITDFFIGKERGFRSQLNSVNAAVTDFIERRGIESA